MVMEGFVPDVPKRLLGGAHVVVVVAQVVSASHRFTTENTLPTWTRFRAYLGNPFPRRFYSTARNQRQPRSMRCPKYHADLVHLTHNGRHLRDARRTRRRHERRCWYRGAKRLCISTLSRGRRRRRGG